MDVLFSSKKNCGRAETSLDSSCQDLVFKDTISAIRCGETLKVSLKTTRSAVFICSLVHFRFSITDFYRMSLPGLTDNPGLMLVYVLCACVFAGILIYYIIRCVARYGQVDRVYSSD